MPNRHRLIRPPPKPPLSLQVTTLWDYPSQHYGEGMQGDKNYKGATPSYLIWNLLKRFTLPGDLVVDPMVGSGTTMDVARDLERRSIGYDLQPTRPEISRVDARRLPLEDAKADFAFIDPPYSDHIRYSDDHRCIGRLNAGEAAYYEAMGQVIGELARVLKPDRYLGLYVSDSLVKGKVFLPIGFELFAILRRHLEPVDIVAVTRHNRTLGLGNYRAAAERENFMLRGFNYLFISYKPPAPGQRRRILEPVPPEEAGKPADNDHDDFIPRARPSGKRGP